MTETLTGFLLARISEDEAAAAEACGGHWQMGDVPPAGHYANAIVRPSVTTTAEPSSLGWTDLAGNPVEAYSYRTVVEAPRSGVFAGALDHIARHDPARVLAECEAKRRILNLWEDACNHGYATSEEYLERAAMALALPYADHPDWREEWRP